MARHSTRLLLWLAPAVLLAAAAYFLVFWPLRDPHPASVPDRGLLAFRDVKIYSSPGGPPLEHANLLVRDGLIAGFGPGLPLPSEAPVLPCSHCVLTAGFWNSHVHFTEPKWRFAAWKSAAVLNAQLSDMLTSRGFTTVTDTGSDLRDTVSLRRRIASGELAGPAIFTAGSALYPPHGVPYYLKQSVPFYLIWLMPQPESPAAAARLEEQNIAEGADLLKLFTGSYIARGKILPMPVDIARAAVNIAHLHRQLAFAHPSNLAGVLAARDSGVDVLAHAPDTTGGIDDALLAGLVARRMSMIPTLKMFSTTVTTNPSYLDPIYAVVRRFHALGGDLMFGTDAGYMTDYDTTDEFRALAACGLNARDILGMLTTAPAARFGLSARQGTIAAGKSADLVLLDRDPESDITAFAHPLYTIRAGRVLYRR